ncbi:MAG: hypothetical protein FVQ81_00015 [Candidatus Glassbacteria bacterium]|nr:hypothetical protein [Candidatus Glassbacteria bacterium]
MGTYLFGQYLLEEGRIDPDQLCAALEFQQDNNKVLGELAREQGVLTAEQVKEILERQLCEDKDFGEAAVEMGLIEQKEVDKLLEFQKDQRVYLGEALVATGAVTREEIDREFERFDSGRDSEEPVAAAEGDDTPLALWSIFSRVLPRFTGGAVLSGGFYPTIKSPDGGSIYSQKVGGEMKLELVIRVSDDLEPLIKGPLDGKGITDFLTSVLEVFCTTMEAVGKAVAPVGKAVRLSEQELKERKKQAEMTSCVEFFLIQPPAPDGEFHQICCMLLEEVA